MMAGSVSVAQNNQVLVQSTGNLEQVETRFGKVSISRENPIVFPRGLLGMPDKFNFCITELPMEKFRQFKLLQCIDDTQLSFITLPVDVSNNIIEEVDVNKACEELEVKTDDLAILLIVSVHRSQQAVRLSVNARAPLFIDAPRRLAAQYVFSSDKYKVQHMITGHAS